MTLLKRKIDVEFQLGTGTFGESGFTTVKVRGLRVQVNIRNTSGAALGDLQMRIYGLPPSLLNQLAGLNTADQYLKKNTIIVTAGDDAIGMSTAFMGQITLAQIDLSNSPDSSLTIVAIAGHFGSMQTASPSSYPGATDAAVIMSDLATKMGYDFDGPNGVSVILSKPYLPGTWKEQADRCARAANIGWIIDEKENTLAIWPRDGHRGGAIPLISPDTGLVGYPSYSSGQFQILEVTTIFNPLVRIAGLVQIESGLQVANGKWSVYDITHALESETPGGKWFTQFNASPFVNGH